MNRLAELNGIPADLDQLAALAVTNYGHFTSMRVEDQRVRGLALHLQRLLRDCRRLFEVDLDPDRIRHLVRHTLIGVGQPVVVRVTVFDPALEIGHPGADAQPQVLVTTRPVAHAPLPALRLQSAVYRRDLPEVKHVGLFGSLRHRRIAQRNGFDEVLFTDADTTISETCTANVGFIDGDRIIWPQADRLPGVTMRLINQDHDSATAPVTLNQLADVDAVFATNATTGIRPISTIDSVTWPAEHPTLSGLYQKYASIPAEQL